MEARVKQDSRWSPIKAFSGLEFVKDEWRSVPEGLEAEAKTNEYLELRTGKTSEAPEPADKKKRGKGKEEDEAQVDGEKE